MGGDVPTRLTYWTGIWEPRREGMSGQIDFLRRRLAPLAPLVSFSAGQRTRPLPRHGVVRLSGRRWLLLRVLAAALEPRGDLSHLIGGIGSWHLLRALGRRPLLFSVAVPGLPLEPRLYARVTRFAPETEALAGLLAEAGVAPDRIEVVPPGVDLTRFAPSSPPPPKPFRLLFASTPADATEIGPRGVDLLIELARREPELEVVLPWRRWGDLAAARSALAALDPTPNVCLAEGDVADMAAELRGVHAVASFFAAGTGKSCPNSVLEGLACGRPALVADTVGIAAALEEGGAGCVAPRSADALAAALERLRGSYPTLAAGARRLAEQRFDRESYLAAYRRLYAELGDGDRP